MLIPTVVEAPRKSLVRLRAEPFLKLPAQFESGSARILVGAERGAVVSINREAGKSGRLAALAAARQAVLRRHRNRWPRQDRRNPVEVDISNVTIATGPLQSAIGVVAPTLLANPESSGTSPKTRGFPHAQPDAAAAPLPPQRSRHCRRDCTDSHNSVQARAAEGSTLRVAYPVPVATLDPCKFRVGGLDDNYAHCVFNRLTAQDTKLQVIPDLAASWEASEDLKTWTFHLRPE